MWKRYRIWLAFIVATLAAIVAYRGTATPPEQGVASMIACYVALSEDLAPLLDPSVTDIAAASPECAPPGDV